MRGTAWSWLKMVVAQRLTVLVFLECISLVVVSALPLSTVRKKESQPQEELYARAARVERRWVDSERPLSPAHRMLRPPPPVSEQEITTKQPFHLEVDSRAEGRGRGQGQRNRDWGAGLQTANVLSRLTPAQLVRLYLLLLEN